MIYPNKLVPNDLIEIISPSNGIKSKKINVYEQALDSLRNFGFNIIEDSYVRSSINGVSSNALNRANELNKAIVNKNVKALIACSGGDYIIQILDLIKYNNLIKNVKWIQGHSDITALLFYVTTEYDIATIYSFNVKTFGENNLPKSMIENNIQFLKGNQPIQIEYGFNLSCEKDSQPWECITNFVPIKGRVIGGCLDSLKDLIGTKYDCTKKFIKKYKADGVIWYFDIAEMTNEDILRTLWQFKNAGWFKFCNGILFGRLQTETTYTNTSIIEAVRYNLEELNIPILINVDIGHTDPVFTIVNGSIINIYKNEKYVMETFFE